MARHIAPGDIVHIGPSRPHKRDGFDAKVVAVEPDGTLHVRHLDVLGRSRFVRPDRITAKRRKVHA